MDIKEIERDINKWKDILFFFFKDCIYLFDRERSQVGREAGRERGGSRPPAEQRA